VTARELLRTGRLLQSLRLVPLGIGAATVIGVAVANSVGGVGPLRAVALILALGSGLALDDAAAATLQASPYPLVRRVGLRIACTLAFVAPLWTIAVGRQRPGVALAAGLTVELAAGLAVVWAAGAWARRRGIHEPGAATAPVLLALVFFGALFPRTRLLAGPGPYWLAGHVSWAAVLVLATAVLALATRDPAAR
jgi:hypothetical protein